MLRIFTCAVIALTLLNGAQLQSNPFTLSVERAARSNDITLLCRTGGSIVPNPVFWVNVSDFTLRSMLNEMGVQHVYTGAAGKLQFLMQPQLEGYYYCSDDIRSGISSSNNVTLLAYPSPDPDLLTDYAVEAGETIQLPGGFEPGALARHYSVSWYKGNVALDTTNPGPRLSIDLSDFTLTIENAQPSDEDDYWCRVEVQVPPGNSFQNSGSTLSLKVYTRPEIVTIDPPERVENIVDRSEKDASFRCTATGKPRPQTVQWRHNNRDVLELGDVRYTFSTISSNSDSMTSELTIQRVKPTDSGTVECVASSTVTLPDDEERTFQTTRTANLAILSDDIELQVTITTEETVQLRLTYPSLGTLPTPVRVLVRFIDAVEFGKEDKVVDGEITDSGVILYEEDRAPYQRFKVQVALVVGDVTGPVFPQSLEDARVYDLTEPSGEDSNTALIIGIAIGSCAAIVIAVVMAGTIIFLRCRRQRIKRKHNKKREEEAKEHDRLAEEAEKAGDLVSRDFHRKRAAELRDQRVVPDIAEVMEEESDETKMASDTTYSYPPANSA